MVRFWNLVHYFVYRGVYRFHLLSRMINPIRLLHQLPIQKRLYAKKGIDVNYEIDQVWKRPESGLATIFAGGAMHGLLILICLGSGCLYLAVRRETPGTDIYPFLITGAITFGVNHLVLFRQDKYLDYFRKFEKMEGTERRKWAWLTLAVIIGIVSFGLGSLVLMVYRLH